MWQSIRKLGVGAESFRHWTCTSEVLQSRGQEGGKQATSPSFQNILLCLSYLLISSFKFVNCLSQMDSSPIVFGVCGLKRLNWAACATNFAERGSTKAYDFPCSFTWAWNWVCQSKGKTYPEGVWERGTEGNIWTYEEIDKKRREVEEWGVTWSLFPKYLDGAATIVGLSVDYPGNNFCRGVRFVCACEGVVYMISADRYRIFRLRVW
jgi:hypothetical protein